MNIQPIPDNAVHLWPDGTWCYHEDLAEFRHMSDDYEVILPADPRWDQVVELA